MRNYLIIFCCLLQGCNSVAQNDSLCEKYRMTSAELVLDYQLYGDTANLDTALYYLDMALSCCPRKYFVNDIGRKLQILSLMRDYDACIEIIPTLENPLLYEFPYYNSVLLKRFYAMRSLYQGDTATYKQYVYSILDELTPFIAEHQETLDSLCKNDLETIWKSSLWFAQTQYYFYKSFIENADFLPQEFDLLKQKGYDFEYIEYIESMLKDAEDFLFYYMF
jgi:uncharacterized protein YceK